MNEKIKEAFNQIHAEETIKEKTKAAIYQKAIKASRSSHFHRFSLIPALAGLVVLLIGGRWLYFTPIAAISIDINPSLELEVNRLGRVISIESYNEEADLLLEELDLKHKHYEEAVRLITENEMVLTLLEEQEILTIAVIGTNDDQTEKILTRIQACAPQKNTYCYCAHPEEVQEAHDHGFSYGKYQAFLEAQALDPSLCEEDVQGMTMREIHELIDHLASEECEENEKGHGHHGWNQ